MYRKRSATGCLKADRSDRPRASATGQKLPAGARKSHFRFGPINGYQPTNSVGRLRASSGSRFVGRYRSVADNALATAYSWHVVPEVLLWHSGAALSRASATVRLVRAKPQHALPSLANASVWLRMTYPLAGWLGPARGLAGTLFALAVAGGGLAGRPWPAADPEVLRHEHANLPPEHPHFDGEKQVHAQVSSSITFITRWP